MLFRSLLVLGGILSLPLGILVIIAGIKIYFLSKDKRQRNIVAPVIKENDNPEHSPAITYILILNFSFVITAIVYHGWTLIIAFKQSMLAGFLTVIFPVISNIYWIYRMFDNTLYFRLAMATIVLGIIRLVTQKILFRGYN